MAKPNIARRLGAFYGLEDGDDAAVAVDGGETPIAEEVSAPVADVAEASAEVTEQLDTLDEMNEAAEQVGAINDAVVEETQPNADGEPTAPISAESAAWVRLALNNAIGKTGLVPAIMPSLESFNGTNGRRSATRVTLEGIGEFLKKIWNAIKTQMQKVWAYVKNWYLKVLDAAPRLKKKAEAISKRTENMTGAPEAKDFDLGVLKALHLKGKAPKESEITGSMKIISEILDVALGSKTSAGYEKTFESMEKLAQATLDAEGVKGSTAGVDGATTTVTAVLFPAAVQSQVKTANEALEGLIGDYSKVAAASVTNAKRFGDDLTLASSVELPGGKAVFTTKPSGEITGLLKTHLLARSYRVKFDNLEEKVKDVDGTGTFKTLSASQVTDICSAVEDICDHIIEYKKAWEKRDKYTVKLKTTMDKIVSSAEKQSAPSDTDESAKEQREKVKSVQGVAKGMQHVWSSGTSFETSIINYGLSVSSSTLSWCEASIREFKD